MKTGWNKGKKYRKYKRLTEEPKMNLKSDLTHKQKLSYNKKKDLMES